MGGKESKARETAQGKKPSTKSSSSSGSGGQKSGLKSVDLTNTSEYQEYLKMVNQKN